MERGWTEGIRRDKRNWRRRIFFLITLCFIGSPVLAQDKAPSIEVTVNQSRVLWLEKRSKTVSVTQPEIADVVVLAPNQLLINGKSVGTTSLIVWNERGGITNFTLSVAPDVVGLRGQLHTLFPDELIEISSSGPAIVLKGEVSNEVVYDKVLSVARTYLPPKLAAEVAPAPTSTTSQAVNITTPTVQLPQTGTAFAGGGQLAFLEENALTDTGRWSENRRISGIIDMLVIRDFRQIQMNVVVAEISLTKLRELGVDIGVITGRANALSRVGSSGSSSNSGALWEDPSTFPPTVTFGQSASGLFSYLSNGVAIATVYRLLQNKDVTQILAQPNLVIKNGRSGGFLAGGEFPVPFPSGGGLGAATFSVEFKPFGVRLDFLPTLTWSNTIDLRVFPEVSEIDPTVSVQVSGFVIPGLRVRRSVSRVEMREGEVLVISGLLDRRVLRDLTKFPFLGDVPILGALFRSTRFRNQESELVFIITPQVVKASPPGTPPPVPSPRPLEDPDMRQVPLSTSPAEQGETLLTPSTSTGDQTVVARPTTAQPASAAPTVNAVSVPLSTPTPSPSGTRALPNAPSDGEPTLP